MQVIEQKQGNGYFEKKKKKFELKWKLYHQT
jgi:hypothetical protein